MNDKQTLALMQAILYGLYINNPRLKEEDPLDLMSDARDEAIRIFKFTPYTAV